MNAIEFLTEHHRHIQDLFDKLDVVDTEDGKAEVFAHLARAIALHDVIEQQHFYPLLKEKSLVAQADDALKAHEQVDERVTELLDLDPGDEQFDGRVEELRRLLDAHLRTEESELFPQLAKLVDGDTLEELGDEMRATVEDLPDSSARELIAPDTVSPPP